MLKKTIKILFVIFVLISALFGYAYFIEPNVLITEEHVFDTECFKDDLFGKFVQISDLHFTSKTKDWRIDQIHNSVKEADPSAVFMTGDYASEKEGLAAVTKLIKKISADYPVYAVFGNWDYDAFDFNIGEIRSAMENAGAKIMINDAITIGEGSDKINIVGVKDPYTSGNTKNDLEKAIKKIPPNDKSCDILLAHSPEIIKDASDKQIDLVLVGHTHGGQIYLPFITEIMIPVRPEGKGYIKGVYNVGNTKVYVNRGIGTSGPPLRFLVPPEVTVINLK